MITLKNDSIENDDWMKKLNGYKDEVSMFDNNTNIELENKTNKNIPFNILKRTDPLFIKYKKLKNRKLNSD